MTDEVVATDPADHRRAAALLSHRATGDEAGAQYIIEEASGANRQTELLAALVDSGGKLLAALRTDMAIEAVGSLFDTWANQDENVDYRRAASIFISRAQSKHDIFHGHIADATTDGRMAELINTTAQCFITVMPELHSPKGRTSLAQITAALSGQENPPDDPEGR